MRLNLKKSLRKNRRLTLTERGDTVVEVLIAIAIVSLVLGGAYVTANRSLQSTRDAEERSNALKLAEAEVEDIKYMSAAMPNALFAPSVPASYCLVTHVVHASSSAQCTVGSNGAPTTAPPAYSMSITRVGNTFTVRVVWTKVGSDRQNNVELKYRAYQ